MDVFDNPRFMTLSRAGARILAVIGFGYGIYESFAPKDGSALNFVPNITLILGCLAWLGLEYVQVYHDWKPYEHPYDLKLAKEIKETWHLDFVEGFRGYIFGDSFSKRYLIEAGSLAYKRNHKKDYFSNVYIEKKFKLLIEACHDFQNLVGERGGTRVGDLYIIMSDQEFESGDFTDETQNRIRKVNKVGSDIYAKFLDLDSAFREYLPSSSNP